jgi:hypothetical protein
MDDLDYMLRLAGLPVTQTLIEAAETPVSEESPPGFEGTIKAMKKHKEIDNPWALSWYMKNKGYHSHRTKSGKKNECQQQPPTEDQMAREQQTESRLDLSSVVEKLLSEKWDSDYETPDSKKGMWDGRSKERLQKRRNALRNKDERTEAESTELKQVNFALRAKSGWGKADD